MISENDRAFLAKRAAAAAPAGPDPEKDADLVAQYRAQMASGEALENAEPLPDVAAYYPAYEIAPGLTAGVAVPHGKGPFPVILHCHGNGFLAGSARSYRRFTMDCARGGFLTITPDYALAPEHSFPTGFNDMVKAAYWVRDNAKKLGGDGSKIVITGNSVGAGIAFGLARYLQTTPGAPKICGVATTDGLILNDVDYAADPKAGRGRRILMWAGNVDAIKDPRISPNVGLKPGMLPPAILLITGSADFAALPGSLAFAEVLRKQNIPFELHMFEGMIHDASKYAQLDGGRAELELLFKFAHDAVDRYA